jgi:hypothetical protein
MGLDWGALLEPGRLAVADYDSVVSINIFVALLCGCIVIGHLLEGNKWVNESITALVIVGSSACASPDVCGFACLARLWFELGLFLLLLTGAHHRRCHFTGY